MSKVPAPIPGEPAGPPQAPLPPAGAPHPSCTIAAGTLRLMGVAECHFCGQPTAAHAEFDASYYAQPQPYEHPHVQGQPHGQAPLLGQSPGFDPNSAGSPLMPVEAAIVQMDTGEGEAVEGAARTTGASASCLSLWESVSVSVGWALTLGAWFHLLFVIPFCEGEKAAGNNVGFCRTYYGGFQERSRCSWSRAGGGCNQFQEYQYLPWGLLTMSLCIVFLWAQSGFAPTRRYLSNVLAEGVEAYVRDLIAAPPQLQWHIQCYHYKTEYYTDSKGKRRSRRKRVNTHSASGEFHYDDWRDISGAVVGSIAAPVRRLRSYKKHRFADAHTQQLYEMEFAQFVRINDRDTHKDVSSGLHIRAFKDYGLAYPLGQKPFGFSVLGYAVLSFLTLSMPFRMYFYARTTPVDFYCVKEVRRRLPGANVFDDRL